MARRRRFEPSGLLAGLLFLAVAVVFAGDTVGAWHPKPVLVMAGVVAGMVLVAFVRMLTSAVRRRAARRTAADR